MCEEKVLPDENQIMQICLYFSSLSFLVSGTKEELCLTVIMLLLHFLLCLSHFSFSFTMITGTTFPQKKKLSDVFLFPMTYNGCFVLQTHFKISEKHVWFSLTLVSVTTPWDFSPILKHIILTLEAQEITKVKP